MSLGVDLFKVIMELHKTLLDQDFTLECSYRVSSNEPSLLFRHPIPLSILRDYFLLLSLIVKEKGKAKLKNCSTFALLCTKNQGSTSHFAFRT